MKPNLLTNSPPRSAGVLQCRRKQLHWPDDTDFRILSIDGGGIRGIFPAAFLAGLEERFLNGSSVSRYFDLIAGTSTGGVIAIGLGAGLCASELRDLYIRRGDQIFPPAGAITRKTRKLFRYIRYSYNRDGLMRVLSEYLTNRKFGESQNRLCIPSCDGQYGDLYVFKTPHHPDFCMDGREPMVKVAAATAAAPTYFRPLEDRTYTFLDGGIWANNPVMVGLVDALSCFTVPRERVHILSIGCGDAPYKVGRWKKRVGGLLAWHDIFSAATRFQSLSALGQAGLLIGGNRVSRVDAPINGQLIALDDCDRARAELPLAATQALDEFGESIASTFLASRTAPYLPPPEFRSSSHDDNERQGGLAK